MLIYAIVALLVAGLACTFVIQAVIMVPVLRRVTTPETGRHTPLPRLTLIVPACNEEAGVAAAVRSMLAQEYPDLELVLINDRSTDRTGAIMVELAAAHPQVRYVEITDLPPGWLGKNHALYVGSQAVTGKWLLFADADIVFDPTTFRRAVAYAEAEGLDHLTLVPEMSVGGYWLNALIGVFAHGFIIAFRPHLANSRRSRQGMGVGAFNLVRRSVYEAIGTHRALSLRPDDDLRLGMRIKRAGFVQRVMIGHGLVRVAWYHSVWEALRGWEKNAYAGMDYSVVRSIGSLLGLVLFNIGPYLAVAWSHGLAHTLLWAAIGLQWAGYVLANLGLGPRVLLYLPALPLVSGLFVVGAGRAIWLTLRQGGIAWRGTWYSLAELRQQSGLE